MSLIYLAETKIEKSEEALWKKTISWEDMVHGPFIDSKDLSQVGPCCPDGERVSDGEDLW